MNIELLVQEFNLFLVENRLAKVRKPSEYYHPSSLFDCSLKIQFDKLNAPKETLETPRSIMRLDNGSYSHRRYIDYWRNLGVLYGDWLCLVCDRVSADLLCPEVCPACGNKKLIYNEVNVLDKDLLIKGKADGIIILKNKKVLWEFKTIKSTEFEKIIKNNMPKPEHIFQANIYAVILDIEHMLIWYENKDTQESKYFDIVANYELFKDALTKIKQIETALQEQTLLKRTCTNKKIPPALWCPYKNICFKQGLTFAKVLEKSIERSS